MAAGLGDSAEFFAADVRHEADIAAAIARAVDRFGRLDCLFSNAGGPTGGEVETVTESDFVDAFNLLVASVVFGIKHAAPVMRAQGRGAIINNSSIAARRTQMSDYLYSMAKAAVVQATRLAGMELGRHGVTVNSIAPGAIATPIFYGGSQIAAGLEAGHAQARFDKLKRNLVNATPMLRTGLPEDIAAAALFLASDDGAFVNCHDLVVDGGMSAGGRTHYG